MDGDKSEKNITTPGKASWVFLMSGNKIIFKNFCRRKIIEPENQKMFTTIIYSMIFRYGTRRSGINPKEV